MSAGSAWSKEDDALLTELWLSGMAATKIVHKFPERTKNAIIGRVHRLNLERKVPDIGTGQSRLVSFRPRQNPFKPKAPIVMQEPKPSAPPEAPTGGVSIMELRDWHCREVIDPRGAPDGLALYCGKFKAGVAFCAYHQSINYVPYTGRRRG